MNLRQSISVFRQAMALAFATLVGNAPPKTVATNHGGFFGVRAQRSIHRVAHDKRAAVKARNRKKSK